MLEMGRFHGSDDVLVGKRAGHLNDNGGCISERFERSDVARLQNDDVACMPDLIAHVDGSGNEHGYLCGNLMIMGSFLFACLVNLDPDLTGLGIESSRLEAAHKPAFDHVLQSCRFHRISPASKA
ncbi:hypothetical protein ALO63_103213 [Pseudomonas amygdali pv. mori]|uniref:Uncharacterized protein n=1 Tax=Pseudomonas amygdali pv. mori TaxID=34065 RepID=A0A0N8S1S6_PSEA0|nr:hypothetical protein ALO63_103213 [Pseudomonas amygdali pv. mori]